MPNPAGYGELTRSVIIANPTDPELALDNHRSYFPGGPFFSAPIMGTGVTFYEEIAEDIVQTWDLFDTLFVERLRIRVYPTQLPFRYPLQSFLFDSDRPYDLPISAFRP
ncbi:hypothetical protein PIB30_065850 [Stylosanthes scabra]|uniref:Uncharacterized protein n=1 Tax=Stylosanthes scabra TaxID=79078 RepID=A0ABU6VKM1_9FABA|nr:hypothetical protein [Stylosanthes scabra]